MAERGGSVQGGDRLRWSILALLFGSTVLNYVDRQTLSLLAPAIQAELGLSDADYAGVVQAFLIAYTLAYVVAGRLTDWLGSRTGLALFVAWWSLANMVTGLVHSTAQLAAARFALGLGEAGNYTAAPKAVGEWFAPRERALGVGVYTAGAMLGATIAPPLVIGLALHVGWRSAFLVTGALGFAWLIAWLLVYRRAAPGAPPARTGAGGEAARWRAVLTDRSVWALTLARVLTDPVWYFYLFWLPKYLTTRGLGLAELAAVAWIVYLAADLGSIGGGWASGRLVRRGVEPGRARTRVASMAVLIAPVGALIALAPSVPATLALASLVAFAHLVWQANLTTLVVDRYPPVRVATVFGMIAAGSGVGGILSTGVVGATVGDHGYAPLFLGMAVLHPLGWLLLRYAATRPFATETAA